MKANVNFIGCKCVYVVNFNEFDGVIIGTQERAGGDVYLIQGVDGSLVSKPAGCSEKVLKILDERVEVAKKEKKAKNAKTLMTDDERQARRRALGELYVGQMFYFQDEMTGERVDVRCKNINIDSRSDTEMLEMIMPDEKIKRFTSNKIGDIIFVAEGEFNGDMLAAWLERNFKPEKPLAEQEADLVAEIERLQDKLDAVRARMAGAE